MWGPWGALRVIEVFVARQFAEDRLPPEIGNGNCLFSPWPESPRCAAMIAFSPRRSSNARTRSSISRRSRRLDVGCEKRSAARARAPKTTASGSKLPGLILAARPHGRDKSTVNPSLPETIALPPGEFRMGSPETDDEARDRERPQHRVHIGGRFAIGRYPVTVAEYRSFVEATGRPCIGGLWIRDGSSWKEDPSKSWRNPGFPQTNRHPVVGVSWSDAQAYVEWLAAETGRAYRLPTEAEWEYACRAGTTMRYSFGETITPGNANYGGFVGGTTEVGTYPQNPWGLFDMHGNVWEWVQDVWHDTYEGAPADGTAWIDGAATDSTAVHVLRGGSWALAARSLRSANRGRNLPDLRDYYFGLRVATTIE